MQTKVIGGGTVVPGVELGVDPTFQAGRMSLRPLDYQIAGQVLGHYRVDVTTAAATYAAGAVLLNLRWADPSRYFILQRLAVSWIATAALTAGRQDITATIARSYTASETTSITAIVLAGNTNKTRVNMGSSLVTQLAVASAAAGITGGTKTLDTNPFAGTMLPQPALTAGAGSIYTPIYENDINAQHPIMLSANEGFVITNTTLLGGTGAIVFKFTIAWAEVVTL